MFGSFRGLGVLIFESFVQALLRVVDVGGAQGLGGGRFEVFGLRD